MTTSEKLYDIIIIGCGPAGIAAGLEFQKYPTMPNFLILEGRNRIGGRAYTDKNTFNSIEPVDIGARWIHHYGPQNPLAVYYTASDKDHIHRNHPYGSNHAYFDIDGTRLSASLINEGKQLTEELYEDWQETLLNKDDISIFDGIRDAYEKIQDEQMRRLVDMNLAFIEQYEGSNLDQVSAKSFSSSELESEVSDLALHTGFGDFIQQIVIRNPLPIELNTIVTNIDIPTNKNESIRLTTKDNRTFLTKYILITIPLGCLKARSIQFTPPLPDWKQNAIDKMGYGLFNKIFLQFPSTFWDEKLDTIFITSHTFRFFLCYPRDHMLVSVVAGNLAYKLEQQTDEEIIEQILQCLKPLYPQIPKPIKWLVTRWGSDPFTYGAYSNFKVGSTYETVRELAKECYDDRVYWAGEHTNYEGSVGCVDHAFESSQRETKRLYDKFN